MRWGLLLLAFHNRDMPVKIRYWQMLQMASCLVSEKARSRTAIKYDQLTSISTTPSESSPCNEYCHKASAVYWLTSGCKACQWTY